MTVTTHRLPLAALFLLALLGLGAAPSSTWAQSASSTPSDETEPDLQVMVLGALHFANPGQDAINPRVGDVTTPERQAQIEAVVDSLSAFRPTKIAVEWPRQNAAAFDSMYHAYRSGTHNLTPNERQQLGFRLADRQNHDHIYPVDRQHPFPMDTVVAYAKKHDPSFIQYFQEFGQRLKVQLDSVGQHASIGEMLRFVNDPDLIDTMHEPYMRMPEVGADSTHVGVRPVASYYERNLHIFANLTAIAEPGDRVILIFGAGHSSFLRPFIDAHPTMTLIDPRDYL